MMKSVKYLLRLQEEQGLNAAAAARLLGLTEAAVSHYRNGRRVMDDETCLAIAMHLNVNPMEIIGAACIDRAEKTGQKSLWEVFMSRTAATAAALALTTSAVTLFLTPGKAEASVYTPSFAAERSHSLYYVKLDMCSEPGVAPRSSDRNRPLVAT
jgi:transcriptional regulator with XRE-family HTH domain